jgi:adenylate cyclase
LSTTPDERLSRALTAFLRQEIQAPASAVTDFLDMIIEDARASQSESLLADLERMRGASVQLNAFVKSLIQDTSSDRRKDETFEEFNRRLRHDLRASVRCAPTSPSSKPPPTSSSARSTPWRRWPAGS